jgi:hypothetical protein
MNTPTSSPADRITAYNTNVVDGSRSQPKALEKRRKTPTRTPYFALIQDALVANPEGLSSNDVFEWLRTHRPHAFRQYDEKKLRLAVQGTLSAQSNKQHPTVWKYEVDGTEGRGYIWKLASAAPSAEAATARGIPQFPLAVDYSFDDAEGSQEDNRAPESSASPAHDSQTAQIRRITPARVQEHDDRSGNDPQSIETEGAAVHGHGTQHAVSDTNQDTEASAHQLAGTTSEPLSTAQAKSLKTGQPQTHTQEEEEPGSAMERPDSAASDVGGANRHHDILKGSLDSDHEAQLHYGKLVSKIRKMKDQCEHKIQKIDAERNALPDMEILEKNVKETAEKVAEFRRVYEEACQSAETARKDLEVTTNKISEIENAEREVEQLKAVSKELRSQLGID